MSGTVWVVMNFDYSNTDIVGVYASRDLADAVCRAGLGNEVCEMPVNDSVPERVQRFIRPGVRQFYVHMKASGGDATVTEEWGENDPEPVLSYYWMQQAPERRRVAMNVLAKDEKHAIKIVNEYRARWLALGGEQAPGGVTNEGGMKWKMAGGGVL